MNQNKLFSPHKLGNIELRNRIVMAPMTRSRAIGNIPNELMATYYGQRSDAGLIVTEGTSPSPNGLGYCRIPGIFSTAQVEGWKKITKAVHAKAGRIFLQIMHTGRISHELNLPEGAVVLAPSAVKPAGQMWTDQSGMQDFPTPKAMTSGEIELTKKEYITAAGNVVAAGFDGLELHGANGYLLEQFLSPYSNQRTDSYGGSIENRCRFVVEVVDGVCAAIGKEKIGIRLSPYGVASDMKHYPEIDATYTYLAGELNTRGIAYVHLVDHSSMGAPEVPSRIKKAIREKFRNTLILAGGYNKKRAEEELQSGLADLIAFAKPFINNPDLVKRLMNDLPLAEELDMKTFYSLGEKGYTDYPIYKA
jgi:N-ethylmaleimide reductase